MTRSHRADRIFDGPLSETNRVSLEVPDGEGGVFSASVVTRINAARDPELLERLSADELHWVEAPDGQRWQLAMPVVVHDPDDELFVLVLPRSLAHRELEWRRRLLEDLESRRGPIAPYIRAFETRIGVSERRDDRERDDGEVTHMVTEDQFVSVRPETDVADPADTGSAEVTQVSSRPEVEQPSQPVRHPGRIVVERIDDAELPDVFSRESIAEDHFVDVVDGRVLAACRTDRETIETIAEGEPAFFVQLHRIEDTPLAALLLAALDDEAQPIASVGWPLDPSSGTHRTVLNRLSEETVLDLALYDRDDEFSVAFSVDAPLEANVAWIRKQIEETMADPDAPAGDIGRAAQRYVSQDYRRLGPMRLDFGPSVEGGFEGLSQIRLAAGIVGYWSSDDAFPYLVANRSFPLERFRAMQRHVLEAAIDAGLYVNEPLRQRAIEEGMVTDEVELIETLLANFAEVSTGLRPNDLDPMDEWDNWDKLVQFARDVGVTPDAEVLELAESRLERAKQHAADSGETSS